MYISVDEEVFNLTNESEIIEGFRYRRNTTKSPQSLIKNIRRETVIEFLRCPETKVYIFKEEGAEAKLIAHNSVAKETIEISNLGNHIIAQNETLLAALNKRQELKENPNGELLSTKMIEDLHMLLFHGREGEIGIGEFRDYDYIGRPVNVYVRYYLDGKEIKPNWSTVAGGDGRVAKEMEKLVEWVNGEEYRKMNHVERVARFMARFLQIHPFTDGNGRVCRLLVNYLLCVSGDKLTNIRGESKYRYYDCLNTAIETGDFKPLIQLIKENQLKSSSDLYRAIMNYSNEVADNNLMRLTTNQIDLESLTLID